MDALVHVLVLYLTDDLGQMILFLSVFHIPSAGCEDYIS